MVGFAPSHVEPTVTIKFFSAGFAAMIADLVTFPLDTAKVRLQIQGEGGSGVTQTTAKVYQTLRYQSALGAPLHTATVGAQCGPLEAITAQAAQRFKYRGMFGTIMTMSREEGFRSLYNGLIPGLQRQMCFASIRIGLYDSVKEIYQGMFNKSEYSHWQGIGIRILAGITTGGFAVACAQPTDVVKVRMQAQRRDLPKRYSGTINAYKTIAVEEGVRGLWKGVLPNITRNAVVNAAELVSYDLIKEALLTHRIMTDTLPCHFISAIGAGFCTTVIASPVDVVKTRFMNSHPGQYTGAINCSAIMFREGGFKAFYKGFIPSFMRLGSWNICMFVCFEQLKRGFMQSSYFGSVRETI